MASEYVTQSRLLKFCRVDMPVFSSIYANANGGYRKAKEASILKNLGVLAGVLDLFLPLPKYQYHGLFLEVKSTGGKISRDQLTFIDNMRAAGYACAVGWGFEDCCAILLDYLDGNHKAIEYLAEKTGKLKSEIRKNLPKL